MRILLVCGAGYVSGKEIAMLNFAASLQRRGHELSWVISSWSDGDFVRRLDAAAMPHDAVRIGFISKTIGAAAMAMTLEQLTFLPWLWLKYLQVLRARKPNRVIHTTLHHVILLWMFLSPARDMFHVHEVIEPTAWYRWLMAGLVTRMRCFIAASEAIRSSLVSLGVPVEKVRVVYSGLEVPDTAASAVAWSESSSSRPLVLGIAGQIVPWKGHDDLIEALSILRGRTDLPFVCRIYGHGIEQYIDHLRRKIDAAGLSAVIQWMGFERDIDKIYDGVDLFVMPSRFEEPFGLVALEAAARAIPVIGTKRGGLTEIIEDGVTGFLVSADDPAALATRIQQLAEDLPLRRRMGDAARRRAKRLFSLPLQAERFEAVMLEPAMVIGSSTR